MSSAFEAHHLLSVFLCRTAEHILRDLKVYLEQNESTLVSNVVLVSDTDGLLLPMTLLEYRSLRACPY